MGMALMEDPDTFITANDAAKRLDLSGARIRQLINAGILPAVRVSDYFWLIRIGDLDKARSRNLKPGRRRKKRNDDK